MRKAAGIMLIIFGILSLIVPGFVIDAISWERATSVEEYLAISSTMDTERALATLLLGVLIVGGGICALANGYYRWAFSGAVCLIVAGIIGAAFYSSYHGSVGGALGGAMTGLCYALPGLLAVIFLVKRKGEFEEDEEEEQEEEQV